MKEGLTSKMRTRMDQVLRMRHNRMSREVICEKLGITRSQYCRTLDYIRRQATQRQDQEEPLPAILDFLNPPDYSAHEIRGKNHGTNSARIGGSHHAHVRRGGVQVGDCAVG